jgi:predicted  nucleic acid-binding Zn-ribbon protein
VGPLFETQQGVWTVQDQFLLLTALQQLDDRLQALSMEQEKLPQQLQSYEQACVEAREQLAVMQNTIDQAERQRRTLERDLDHDQAQLVKTQSKLREVKTNKEYSAVLAEIATGKQRINILEDQILELMEQAEQGRQALQQLTQHVQQAVYALEKQHHKIEQAHQELAQQVTTHDTERQDVVARLDAKLYTLYQRLVAQRGGLAVVQLHEGTCGGCHLKVQPQLVSEIRRQETLITCPHCQRMLLWPA